MLLSVSSAFGSYVTAFGSCVSDNGTDGVGKHTGMVLTPGTTLAMQCVCFSRTAALSSVVSYCSVRLQLAGLLNPCVDVHDRFILGTMTATVLYDVHASALCQSRGERCNCTTAVPFFFAILVSRYRYLLLFADIAPGGYFNRSSRSRRRCML